MICRLPESVHHALLSDATRAMARKTPAVSQAAAEVRAEENARLIAAVPDRVPTTAFDVFAEDPQEAAK